MDQQIPPQTRGKTVKAEKIVHAPMPATLHERPSTMTIRIYDVCAEHGAHTDPDLQRWGYAEHGI